jgi:uncharacterized protein
MKKILFFIGLLIPGSVLAQYTVESVPNQKLINNSYVSNPDQILDERTVVEIDGILGSLEGTTSVQVAVVAVNSIGDADVFDFAQALFLAWGIGNKANDNGLLILLVKDEPTIRFHTGDGIESTLPDALCKQIQREFMVPAFKNNDYNGGMLAGIREIQNVLTNPRYAEELKAPDENEVVDYTIFAIALAVLFGTITLIVYLVKALNGKFTNSKKPEFTLYPEMRLNRWLWIFLFMVAPTAILFLFSLGDNPTEASGFALLALYGYYLLTAFYKLIRTQEVISRFKHEREYYQIVQFLKSSQGYWLLCAIVFPFPMALYFVYHLFRKRIYRNHSRQCTTCNGDMHKLNEEEDDAFLSADKRLEETLRSVDYDVWQCKLCQATEAWNYPRNSSKYKPCPYCKTHAYYLAGRKTLVSATYSSAGEGEETHSCKFCGKTKKETYSIAQLVESTSSSSGSSSSSSSSSSSGGSWGGGSSSGGGASSSW